MVEMTEKNQNRCVYCFNFKTREIPKCKLVLSGNNKYYVDDENINISGSGKIIKHLKSNDSVQVYYCSHNRTPFVENETVFRKVVKDCTRRDL